MAFMTVMLAKGDQDKQENKFFFTLFHSERLKAYPVKQSQDQLQPPIYHWADTKALWLGLRMNLDRVERI